MISSGKKILVVDDDKELCEEIAEALSLEGFSVKCIFDGEAGKKAIAEYEYELAVLDLKLPGMSGYELLKFAKKQKPSRKVVILTGSFLAKYIDKSSEHYSAEQQEISTLADMIIDKPFDMEKMIIEIYELLK